ncbi:MAG TPA: TIGR02530 family flagellar biosynthesis protein [Chondromyces sp.]|nr:TIGR02530 family flagellar biosynthesis protein [Chondromyces sp.]
MERAYFPYLPSQPITSQGAKRSQIKGSQPSTSFSKHLTEAFKQTEKPLVVSKHASQRLIQRGITIDEGRWKQIEAKVAEAREKGVNESLVILKDAALIVSAKNNTVITAMNRQEANSQIFTKINGTILLD